MITHPLLIDAPPVVASELVVLAWLGGWAVVQSAVFVRTIHTIRVSVTYPSLGDARGFAPLLVLGTGEFFFGITFSGFWNE